MKNLLNLKGLCRSSQLALNPDGQTTVERRSNDGHSRRHLPVGLTRLLSLFLLLTLGVGQTWADNYIEGDAGLITTGWNKKGYRIDNTPYNNYAVAAGKYFFKITDGNTESGGSCFGTVTGVTSSNYGVTDGCMWINLTGINDVNITWANSGWNVNITVTPSSYFIKYPWGDNHAWTFSAPMTACSDGTYACTGPYNGTTYDFGRRGYDGGAGAKTGQTATVNNSPSTDETCVFNVTTSGALTITRCNKVTPTNKIYFDNSVSNFTGNIYLIIGHDKPTKFSCAYKMTQLAGTKLHYVSVGANWTDATYYAIVGNSAASISAGSWGSESLSTKQTGGYTAAYTGKYDLDGSNKQYLFTTASSGNGKALTITHKNTGYSNLNYTQSVTLCTKAYGADSYSANTSSLTSLNFTTYNLTGVGSVSTQQTNNMNGSTGVASGSACQAATTTINVGDAPASWVYDGIYTAMNGGSPVEDDQEYTYYPRAATNYYVRFHEVHDPSVSLAASSAYLTTTGGLRALTGETITLTATALYNVNSLVYTYEYSTNSGSSWTTIASRSASNTQTFTANSTGDYIFRVTLPDEAGTVNGTTNVHMTEMYTIKVKKNSNWVPNKLYVWNKSTEITQYGAFPGSTGKFTNHGQWYEFELNSDFDSFIVSASNHDTNHTSDVTGVTGSGCYTIGGTTGTSCAVTSGAACPSAPTVTASAATSVLNTKATLNGSISATGNDALTDYGFYWSTTYKTAETLKSSGTQVQKGTSDHIGAIAHELTGLSAGSTVYYIAYATNGQGTTVSDVQTFTTEGMHDVTVNAEAGGTVSYNGGAAGSTCTARAGIETASANIVATANEGYYFVGWQLPDGTITKASETSYDGVTQTITIKATADGKTVTALFNVRYALLGSVDTDDKLTAGMPGWGEGNEAPFTYSAGTYTKTVDLTLPNTTYKFKIVDRRGATHTSYGLSSKAVIPADGDYHPAASTAADAQLATAGVGTYTLTVQTIAVGDNAGKPQVKITNPASHLITMGVKTDFGASDAAGGSISAVDGETTPNVITNGKYIKHGGTIVVTATPSIGYSLAGWYSDAACTSAYAAGANVAINDGARTLTLSGLDDDKTIYAKFTENRTTVTVEANNAHGTVTIAAGAGRTDETHASVGVYTTASVTAVPDAGYYFAGWTLSNETFTASGTGEANTTITITGAGTAGTSGTLTANFVELDKIYFRNWNADRNEPLWENVYVYFGISWNGDNRPIASSTASNIVQMEQIGTSNIYWAYVPRAEYTNSNIAFSNHQFTTGYTFYQYESVKWGSYNRKLNMCVPKHGDTETIDKTLFYKSYWKNYGLAPGAEAGYYMKRLNSSSNGYEDAATDCKFVVVDENTISYKLRVDNMDKDYHNKYMVHSAGGIKYVTHSVSESEGTAITTDACTDVNMTQYDDGTPRFLITPSSEGYYTITIDQSGDVMKISVNYPVAVGDYLLVQTNSDESKILSHSDIIKGGLTTATVSMHLDMVTSGTKLILKKCTSTAGGTPTFGAKTEVGTGTGLFNTTTFNKGNGVYKFDITISGDEVTAIASDGLYTGKYYIKTDYAPGGWVNFKQNVLEQNTINFSNEDANTFDYYHCAWVDGDGKNVKCIIANDYNEQLTDTLIGDDILGKMDDGTTPRQYLAENANVRFSYNSYTNELKRAYINGASGWEASFLSLKDMTNNGTGTGTKTITKTDGTALTNDTISFRDKGNWIYQIDVKAGANSYIWLSANYKFRGNDHMQNLIGTSTAGDLLIGSGLTSSQRMTLIYDFKTNNLIAAWTPAETYGKEIDLNSDVLLIHNRKTDRTDEVNTIDLTEGGKIKNIDRVYSALRFQKTTADGIIGLSGNYASAAESYYRYNYWISFPYDVKMTDIFGVADYGSKWRIQYYDGAERASKGWYLGDGTTTFWKTMPMNDDAKLKKGEGYVLQLSPSAFKATGSGSLWALVDEIYLYFPSQAGFGHIGLDISSVTLSSLPCTKGLYTDGSGKDHNLTDSHWHVFGIPTFKNATGTTGTGDNYDGDEEKHSISEGEFYFYEYNNNGTIYNTYIVTGSSGFTFQPMHAYMIQMTGTLNFAINSVPASVAARQKKEIQNYDLRLELASEGQVADQTFVTLRENAVADFALNEDLTKIHNTGKANIYSYAGVYDVAANILPVENRTVVLGVETAKAGTYTFSMPDNFDGIVTLIDNFTQTRTNLALGDYEVSLPKGEMNDRFLLEINIRQVPTAIDGVEGGSLKDGKAHKYIENGAMYILRDGKIYDARGNKVK